MGREPAFPFTTYASLIKRFRGEVMKLLGGREMPKIVTVVVDRSGAEGFFRRAMEHAEKLDKGDAVPEERTIAFEDPAMMMRMLTTERMRLLDSLLATGESPLTGVGGAAGAQQTGGQPERICSA